MVALRDFNLNLEDPMTEERLPLAELLAKAGDGDFLRGVAEVVLRMLMEADAEGLIGAGRYERQGDRIVSVAAIIAVAVNTEGRREIVGLHIGPSEAETLWSTFLESLVRRGLRGVKLVISDAHEGLKAAIRRVMGASWQRCRVHWMRNALP
jgi:transposase-like protein